MQNKEQEFVEQHVIQQLLARAGAEVERFLCWFSIYRRPVGLAGARLISEKAGIANWQGCLTRAIDLTLAEYDRARERYCVSPMLETCGITFGRLVTSRRLADEAAFAYYESVCTEREELDPVLTEEWIYHALNCGRENVAAREGGRLVNYLRDRLAYLESKRIGEWVLAEKKQPLVIGDDAFLLNEYAFLLWELSENKEAIRRYEQSLEISKKVYGEKSTEVATRLNNLGLSWAALGDQQKAIRYYEQALAIDRAVYGDEHPAVARDFNNLGGAYFALGEKKQAKTYFEAAYRICLKFSGPDHPSTRTTAEWLARL